MPSYVHLCTNETIHGVEFQAAARPCGAGQRRAAGDRFFVPCRFPPGRLARVGLAFGGAQKNLGPAGLTIVVVRDDLLGHALTICPSAFNYKTVADNSSMYNTPPTWGIYVAGLTFQWLLRRPKASLTGVAAMEQRNIAKARLLYDFIDGSPFYENRVRSDCRSRMNVPFFLKDEARNEAFLAGAREAGPAAAQGTQVRRRHARQHLQRHAAGGRAGACDLHARIRAVARLKCCREPDR